MFFLTGGIGLENKIPNPAPGWLPASSWDELCRLNDLPAFAGIRDHVQSNVDAWKKFYDAKSPQTTPIPEPWASNLDTFRVLVVLRCIRPDKVGRR